MRLIAGIILVFLSSFLSGCDNVIYVPVEKPYLNIPDPEPIVLDQIEVIDVNNQTVVMSLDDYRKLLLNMYKMKVYIQQQKDIIGAYRQYYEKHQK